MSATQLLFHFGSTSSIQYIVLGTYGITPENVNDGEVNMSSPQYCFVKGEATVRGQSCPLAVPVSRSELRDMAPEAADFLDSDSGCNWRGRLPGRFYG